MILLQEQVLGFPVPAGWRKGKLKRTLKLKKNNQNTGMQENNLLSLSYGKIIPKDIESNEGLLPESFETYQIVDAGDIVLRLTDLQNDKRSLRQGLVRERGIVTSAYDAIRPDKDNDPSFWAYTLLALDLAKFYYSMGGGVRQSISFKDFPNTWIAVPDLETQIAIAAFLDRETTRIDQLIAKKVLQTQLLTERQNAMIEAATDHAATVKSKLGHHVRILPGYAFSSEDFQTNEDGIRLLRGANIAPGSIRWDDVVYWPLNRIDEVQDYRLRAGDIVFGMDRPWVSAGIRVAEVTEADVPSLLLQRCCRLTPNTTLDRRYLKLILSSPQFQGYFEPIMTGVSVPHVSAEQIGAFRFALIPVAAQQRLVLEIENQLINLRKVTSAAKASIKILKERRAALITAAVTGQIDVQAKLSANTTKSNHAKFRVIIGAEIIHRHQDNPKFGHVKLQKIMYLAEAHAGVSELQGNYLREAAGPYDRALIEGLDRSLEVNGFYRATKPEKTEEAVSYSPLAKAGQHKADLKTLLGTRTEGLKNLISLLSDFDKRSVEAIATLYAVWNDAKMDGQTPDDAAIINGVLTEWHSEKGEKFKEADLRHWLDWMKRNKLTPRGEGPRTIQTKTKDMFT